MAPLNIKVVMIVTLFVVKNKASCRVKPVASPREKNARPATKEDFKLLMARNPGLTLCSKFLKYSLYHPHKRLCVVRF